MPRTIEQQKIIDSNANTLVVNAFAGTGKTTTLIGYSEKRKDQRILYAAFNKAIQQEAEAKFRMAGCDHVTVRTSHSIAWSAMSDTYRKKLSQYGIRPTDALRVLPSGTSISHAKMALDCVKAYCVSADKDISVKHISAAERLKDHVLSSARALWEAMKDPDNGEMAIHHDGYLKLFQLSEPSLGYDIVLFDEAQDANPVTYSMLTSQGCGLLLAGDAHQAIYQFRGATAALEHAANKADESLYLTSSFRFGTGVANIANHILTQFKGENNVLKGLGRHKSTEFVLDGSPYAVIARTNAMLFAEAVAALDAGIEFGYVGAPTGYRIDAVLDAYHLSKRRHDRIQDWYYKTFSGINDMERVGKDTDDYELLFLVKMVANYGDRIPSLVKDIKRTAIAWDPKSGTKPPKKILVTGHKSKGLEFDQVLLADDFASLVEVEKGAKVFAQQLKPEEINLIYVAATRAERSLEVNPKLAEFLALRGISSLGDLNQDGAVGTVGRLKHQKKFASMVLA